MLGQVVMRREQETARAARRITDGLPRLRGDHIHHRGDERARCEVLARAAFHVLGVLLQQALIGVALHVGGQARPLLLVDQIHDQPTQLGRVLDLVLCLAENDAQHARPFAEGFQDVSVMGLQLVAILGQQAGPVFPLGNGGSGVPPLFLTQIRRLRLFIRHFQEQEEGQLLDIIPVGKAVITEDVAVVPELLDEGGAHSCLGKSFRNRRVASLRSISLAATASVSSSHAGPSVSGSMPFKRRKTTHAPSAARLLPSMNG